MYFVQIAVNCKFGKRSLRLWVQADITLSCAKQLLICLDCLCWAVLLGGGDQSGFLCSNYKCDRTKKCATKSVTSVADKHRVHDVFMWWTHGRLTFIPFPKYLSIKKNPNGKGMVWIYQGSRETIHPAGDSAAWLDSSGLCCLWRSLYFTELNF